MKKIEAEVDIKTNVQPTIADIKELKKQLKTISDPEQFKQLQQQINDYEDALKSARTGADNFAEVLGTLPGPIGSIGNQIGGTLQSLKQFGGLKFNDIKNSFSELGKDLVDAGKGIAQLTGLTKVYTIVSNGASKALQAMGISAEGAATASKALGVAISGLLAATGLILLTALITAATEAWDYYTSSAERAAEAQKKLNESIQNGIQAQLEGEAAYIKREGDLQVAQLKAKGASAKAIYDEEQKWRELTVNSLQRAYDEIGDKDSDFARKTLFQLKDAKNQIKIAEANFQAEQRQKGIDHNNKVRQDNLKNAEQTKKDIEAAGKAQTDAYRDTLSERDKEIYDAGLTANERLLAITKAGVGDRTIVMEAYRKKLQAINDKYDKEALDKEKDFWNKAKEAADKKREKEFDDAVAALEDQTRLDEARLKTLTEGTIEYFNQQLKLEDDLYNEKIKKAKGNAKQIEAINTEHEQNLKDIKLRAAIAEKQIQLDRLNVIAGIGNSLAQLAGKNKALATAAIAIEKAAAVGSIIVNTQIANLKAVAASPLTLGQPWVTINNIAGALAAGAAIASGVKAIQDINAVSLPGVQTTSVSGGSNSVTMPSYGGGAASATIPTINTTGGANPATQISQTIQNSQQSPIRAYVVSSDVTTQQALDRKTNKAATFGLG